MPSSQELHPETGARFVCERVDGDALVYRFAVFAAGGATYRGELRCGDEVVADPPCADPWAQAELLKLARVLRHGRQARLTRWRGP